MSNCSTCGGVANGDACFSCGESWAACCCPKPAVDSCPGECGVVKVNALALCSESQLNLNKCTLVVESEVAPEMDCLHTPESILKEAYSMVNTSTICDTVPEEYLRYFNSAVRAINDLSEPLWASSRAVVKTCGRCEFYTPPQFNRIIAVSNELKNCNNNCNPRRYIYINSEGFIASRLVNSFTIRENKIIIKDPMSCGVNDGIPSLLMVDYYKKVREAKNLSDCLDIDDSTVNYLIDWIVANRLGVKFQNITAISIAEKRLERFDRNYPSYDSKKVATAHYRNIRPAIRLKK